LAEKERALISTPNPSGLAKARGVTLGNPRFHVACKSAMDAVKSEADTYAAAEAQKAGARTLREIAEVLTGGKGGDPNNPYRVSNRVRRYCANQGHDVRRVKQSYALALQLAP
jgi:hypothetical protein